MKAKILSGQPALGVSVMIPSPQIVEMIGALGFDWVLIDCEHGTNTPESVELMIMAAEVSGITPIVRPKTKDPDDVLKVMDRGAMGVQAPHVNTAADAQRVVEAVKYHPLGKRGLAAGTRPSNYGLGLALDEYVTQVNRETLVCVQLEEVEALQNIDEILRVKGVDVFFVGPSDLSQSMGYPGQTSAPPVQAAIDAAFEAIVRAGKVPGSAGSTEATRHYLQMGCRYVYTHVPRLLGAGAAAFFDAVRAWEG
ncbi:MAG: 2-dehydro-3-deoxyglucarate aldolase [Anaerolineae bacterium]|nr:2-dehydro-3-deoxyglucarate aldolase [Anaerolineae bacterium]